MDQPSWMQSTEQAGISSSGAVSGAGSVGVGGVQRATASEGGDATIIRTVFHFVNIGVSVMMAASAAFGLIDIDSAQTVILSLYLMIFAIMLFMYEMARVLVRCDAAHRVMLKNFGFFFGAKGRGLYLVFVGFLNFPLDSDLSTWTGLVTLGWGVATVLAYMCRPEWFESPKPAQTVSA